MQHKDAIILAGGLGTRLAHVVPNTPKCLAPIAGKPFLWYQLEKLKQFHFCKVVLSLGHLSQQVIDYVESIKLNYSFSIEYCVESEPLGTGGAILLALELCDTDDIVIVNGDSMFDVDIDTLIAEQQLLSSDCTLALAHLNNCDRYGTVKLNKEKMITAFLEKQSGTAGLINAGIYILFKPSFLSLTFPKKFSFESDYLSKSNDFEHHLAGITMEGYFIDIGVEADYVRAQSELPKLVKI
jgi:D-glycero-alpha-D-manno-heptose 1-phosphate guanylyltransferase